MTVSKPFVLLIIAMLFSSPSVADLQDALTAFKSCLEANIPNERAKDRASVDALLKVCETEYQAVAREIYPGARKEVLHDLKHQIAEQLDKR